MHGRVEYPVTGVLVLGQVHGRVGVPEQVLRACGSGRAQGDTYAGVHEELLLSHHERPLEALGDPTGHLGCVVGSFHLLQQDHELIAPEAGQCVARTQAASEAIAYGDEQQVCSRVLEAAHETRASVADLQYPIGDAIERFRFGVALHVGRILYGNIGGGNRLDFTCIGPAVNLAARLEKIASQTRRTVVASEGFAGICRGGWSDLGEFPVAGFSKAARVYGLADEKSAA